MGVMLRPSEYPKEWCRCAPDRFRGAGAEKRKKDFSHPQADAFAGAKAEEKVGLLRSK